MISYSEDHVFATHDQSVLNALFMSSSLYSNQFTSAQDMYDFIYSFVMNTENLSIFCQ